MSAEESRDFGGTSRFAIIRRLSEGGMGVVYEAMDQIRNERVALKTLNRVDASLLFRLKSEFRILQNLYHPNLIRLGQLFEDDGNWFFTMEMIDGQEFLPYVRGGQGWTLSPSQTTADEPTVDAKDATVRIEDLPEDERPVPTPNPPQGECDLRRLRQSLEGIVGGLHALHQSGIVHCDVKPGNIMVTNRRRVVLVDFGLAQDIGDKTHRGTLLGTPAYMSPEQAAGAVATTASDWYSVGATLYEALSGRLPFTGRSMDIMKAKQEEDPEPPSSYASEVPEDLETLCMELLRRPPGERPTGPELLERVTQSRAIAAIGRSNTSNSPFVGRLRELSMLAGAFESVKPRAPVVVYVESESGLGKTALVDTFLAQVRTRPDSIVLRGRCFGRESVPFKGVDHLIDSLSYYLASISTTEVRALLPKGMAELLKVFPILRQVAGIGHKNFGEVSTDLREQQRRAFSALRDLLANIAERKRLVIAIDDLQWSDIDSTVLLSTLVRGPNAPSMLLIGTYRSENTDGPIIRALTEAASPEVETRRIQLEPLSLEETQELARALLRSSSNQMSEKQIFDLANEVNGSPLLLAEVARHFEDASVSGRLASSLDISLDDVIGRRLQKLPSNALALLQTIATMGRPIDPEFAMRASKLSGAQSAIELLESTNMVSIHHGRRNTVEVFHQRLQEAIMGALSPERCNELYQNIAEVIGEDEDQDPELLLDIAIATGSSMTLPYILEAAEQAEECLAFERAAELYQEALKRSEGDEASVLRRKLADVLCLAGHGRDAALHYLDLAAEVDGFAQLDLIRRAADNFLSTGHIEEGLEHLAVVMQRLGLKLPATRRGAIASLLGKRLRLAFRRGRYKAPEGTTTSDPSDESLMKLDTLYASSTSLGMIDHLRGSLLQSQYLLWALQSRDERHTCRALSLEIGFLAVQGAKGGKQAESLGKNVLLRCERLGDDFLLGGVRLTIGVTHFFAGRFSTARSVIAEAITYLERDAGGWWELNTAQFFHCLAQLNEGDFLSYAPSVQSIINRAERRNDAYTQYLFAGHPSIWCGMRDDNVAPAREVLRTVLEHWPSGTAYQAHYSVMAGTAMSLLYEGKGEEALALIEESKGMLRDLMIHRMPFIQGEVDKLRGRAALQVGDDKTAHAIGKRLRKGHMGIARALGTLLVAPLAAKNGATKDAQKHLLEAKTLCSQSGAKHLVQACNFQLGKLVGGKRGDELSNGAVEWMVGQGVAAPENMLKFLTPGF